MIVIKSLENFLDNSHNHYSSFLIEPLEKGQGITLGNSLRRTLLSELSGYAPTTIKINNISHEFVSIPGVKEDLTEILLNVREIVFKDVSIDYKVDRKSRIGLLGFIAAQGPILVTAGMLKLPKNTLLVVNPDLPICSIINQSEFFLELKIEHGRGASLNNQEKLKANSSCGILSSALFLDTIFSPVKRVNYQVRIIYDSNGNLKESLVLEILTNGSITPKRALQDAFKSLLNLFFPLIATKNILEIVQHFNSNGTDLVKKKSLSKKLYYEN